MAAIIINTKAIIISAFFTHSYYNFNYKELTVKFFSHIF